MPMDMMESDAEDQTDTAPDDSSDEMPSVFLTKDQLGGKTVKKGDKVTMTVQDVDPESGDVEAMCDSAGSGSGSGDYSSDFDKAMPEEEM